MTARKVSGFLMMFIFLSPLAVFSAPQFYSAGSSGPLTVTQKTDYVFKTGVQSQDGHFFIGKTGLNLKKQYRLDNGLPLEFAVSLDHYVLQDRTTVDLPASLQSKGLSVGTKFPMPFVADDRIFLGLDAGPYFQTAKDHDFSSDAFRFKSRIYGIYKDKDNDQLIFAAGIMADSGYEDRVVTPFAGFTYIVNDRWSLNFLSNEPAVIYRMNDRMTWKGMFSIWRDEFEVVSGARKGDIVKMSEFHAGIGMEYQVSSGVSFQVSGGWAFNRKYEYLKNGGKVIPDDGFFLGYCLKAKF